MFERFTDKARTVVVLAQQKARERGDDTIDTGHLLRALVAVPDNLAVMVLEGFSVRRADVEADLDLARPTAAGGAPDASALAALGIDLDEVRRRVEEAFGPGALDRARRPGRRSWCGGAARADHRPVGAGREASRTGRRRCALPSACRRLRASTRAPRRRHDLPDLPRAAARGAARPCDLARSRRPRRPRPAHLDPRRPPGRGRRP